MPQKHTMQAVQASRESLNKDFVSSLKKDDGVVLASYVQSHLKDVGVLLFVLEKLGRLPASFNAEGLIVLMSHENESVRVLAVKNLGKLCAEKYLSLLSDVARNDTSTLVRREAISSIGRMRTRNAIPFLKDALNDKDPKVVCQAMRGLLVFKGDADVDSSLKKLSSHENEMVRAASLKEFPVCGTNTHSERSIIPHAQTYAFLKNVVVNGDVRDVLRFVPDESVHLTFTSPPYYNARDYSIYASYDAYLTFLEDVFSATLRVTKEGRFLIVNTSPVIVPRISRAHSSKRYPIPFDLHARLVKMGWEFIDDIVWEKPEFSVRNRIGGFLQHRKPLSYKPNTVTEYLMVYRKKTDKLLDWNIRQYSKDIVDQSRVADGFERTNVWKICPKSDKVHSAVFPEELCQRVVEYYSYKGDLIFDPFAGSGTLGRTAMALGRNFFMTEVDGGYFKYMKQLFAALWAGFLGDIPGTRFCSLQQFEQISNGFGKK